MTDVTVNESGYSVSVSTPSVGTVSTTEAITLDVPVSVTGSTFGVSVIERPTGQLAIDGLDPGEYIRSLDSLDTKIQVEVDGSGNATVKHAEPSIATQAYAGYPTVIRTDATGHIVAITVESDKGAYRDEIGLGDISTRQAADFLGVDNTTIYGRSLTAQVDAAAARSFLSLGTAALEDESYFAERVHTHDASVLISGKIDPDRIPDLFESELAPYRMYFDHLDGGDPTASSFSNFDDLFVEGSRFDGGYN